jgi:hypothetical protein
VRFAIVLFAAAMTACSATVTTEEKLAMLDTLRREELANIIRHEGECRAVAMEFKGDPLMVGNCMESHRFLIETTQRTVSDIDKRIAEVRAEGCKASLKASGGRDLFAPNDC